MCTVVILRRPGENWPLILAANRDEMTARPWRPPARHWPDRPETVAGMDELAGGTWLGVNDFGVVGAVMNREGALGPVPDKRSRGELVLEALDHADALNAAEALGFLDGGAYRPFNLVIADSRDAYWLKSLGDGPIDVTPLPPGISMLTSRDLNDLSSSRIKIHLPLFEKAPAPDPGGASWDGWEALMARGCPKGGSDPRAAMVIEPRNGYGTVSGSLIALPRTGSDTLPVWLFCAGPPGSSPYRPISL